MDRGIRRWGALATAATCALAVAACGGSSKSSSSGASSQAAGSSSSQSSSASSDPQTLIKQAFSNSNAIKSGRLRFAFTITPSGSSTLNQPISLSFGGPFSRDGAKTNADLTVNASVLGKHATFGFVVLGQKVFVKLQGETYAVPASQTGKFKLGSTSGGTPGLQSLGIDPTHWLTGATTVGDDTVDGTSVSHVRAKVDVAAMLSDVNTLLRKQSQKMSSTGSTPQISSTLRQKIASSVKNPTVDMYVGKDDSILRRFDLHLSVPVTGQASTRLGGMTSAAMALTSGYSEVNKAQSITAPANPRSFQQLQAKLQTLLPQLEGAFGGLGGGSSSSSGSGSTSGAQASKYLACVKKANGDSAKVQKCQTLLSSSG